MVRSPPAPSVLLLLVACAEAPPETAPSVDEAPSEPPGLAGVVARVAATEAAITPDAAGWSASQPMSGSHARFEGGAARVRYPEGEVVLVTLGVGREGRIDPGGDALASPGECQDPTEEDVGGACVQRLEFDHDNYLEWWASRPEGLQVGWDVAESPAGDGPLEIALSLTAPGAELDEDGTGLRFSLGERLVHFGGLAAWDDAGLPLAAWMEWDGQTLRIRVDDADATWPVHIDPVLTSYSWYAIGSSSYYMGISVAGAGDVNGDGYDDVIVGASGYSSSTGRAYVYHGSASGLSYSVGTTLTGASTSNYFGSSVAGAGDVNGDGYDDVIVGAYYYSSGYGAAYVYHGSSSGISSTASRTLTGSSGYQFGRSVAGAGDTDGDGYDDVIVGAPGYSSYTGRAMVYEGSSSGIRSSATTTITGTGTSNYLGYSVSGAGDVNGDGYDDVIVGSYYYSSGYGRAGIYHGSSSGVSSSASRTLTGSSSSEYFGIRVTGGMDVNGDGYSDVAVAAPYYNSSQGRVAVYHGSSYGIGSSASSTVYGSTTSNYFGWGLGNAGDTDRDGYDDLIVGAYYYSSGYGATYVYGGSSTGISTTADTTITGISSSAYCGYSVSGAGDTNGDGYDDVITGCEYYSSGYGLALMYLGYADADGDGYIVGGGKDEDCDDGDATVYPGATEVVGDGVDQDCDGSETCYNDADNDGYLDGSGATRVSADSDCTDAYEGTDTDPTTDCDDGDAKVHPGATEIVGDGTDQDCDGYESCYADADDDGYPTSSTVLSSDADCTDSGEATASEYARGTDCDDTDASVHPGATEVCDSADTDEDCDGLADDADPSVSSATKTTWYPDGDGDGYGTTAGAVSRCDQPSGYVAVAGDCNDSDAGVNPGATEVVGTGGDENCDGMSSCYTDADGDGYATATVTVSADADCDDPGEATAAEYALGEDCDEGDSAIHPGATEICDSADTDEDCNGLADDDDPSVSAATTSTWYPDADGDGFGDPSGAASYCDAPDGWVSDGTDCDDTDPAINPDATEVVGDEVDSDCDGEEVCYSDVDGDGWASPVQVKSTDADCSDPGEASASVLALGEDCDDGNTSVNPGQSEVCDSADTDEDCNGLADDADPNATGQSTTWTDADGDGYGDEATMLVACDPPAGNVAVAGDCDDTRADVNPGATEVCDVGDVDEDCNGLADDADPGVDPSTEVTAYTDADGDGYGTDDTARVTCDPRPNEATAGGDCDDSDPRYHPGAEESDCTDPNDYNCDGSAGAVDSDGDGYFACQECDDGDPDINPAATEVCDGLDNDCDGIVDGGLAVDAETWYPDADGDGYGDVAGITDCEAPEGYVNQSGDCDDDDASVNPGMTEVCNDIDDDCDNEVDEGACDGGDSGGADSGGGGRGPKDDGDGDEVSTCGCDARGGSAGIVAIAGVVGLAVARRRRAPRVPVS